MISIEMIEDGWKQYLDSFDSGISYYMGGQFDGFLLGAEWAQKKIMDEAASGFEEWKEKQIMSVVGKSENEARGILGQSMTPDGVWQAAKISSMKEIESLKQRLSVAVEIYQKIEDLEDEVDKLNKINSTLREQLLTEALGLTEEK